MAVETEDRLIGWLSRLSGTRGLGDDVALLPPESWAVTVDRQAAGVHVPEDLDPAVFARRLLEVNLSDLAASGAEPAYAFLVLATPPDYDRRAFFRALLRHARPYGLLLAGGDLSRASRPEATLTLLGRRPRGGSWLRRSGGQDDWSLWVGGEIGESAIGRYLVARGARLEGSRVTLPTGLPAPLHAAAQRAVRRHLQPAAQLTLGRWLGRRRSHPAVIDISDGLALDLHRLCRASGVGAVVEAELLPGPDPSLARALSLDVGELALGGGEDYVLLFALPKRSHPPFPVHRIGTLTADRRILLRNADGEKPLEALGWDHLRSPSPGGR